MFVSGLSRFYGYVGRVLRVNLTTREVRVVELEEGLVRAYLGGRGLNVVRLYYEVSPGVNPLSPENKLFFGVGPVVGTGFPLGARLNVTAKSPQTGILGDSNVGGHFAPELKYAGFDQVVIEGRSSRPVYLYIHDGAVEVRDADGLWGMRVREAYEAIRREVGDPGVQIAVVGPAAENLVRFSGIFFNRSRPAARTGLGTVMASKGLKAIAVRGDGYVEVAKPELFEKLVEEVEFEVYSHEQYWPRRVMGTTRILMAANKIGVLPGKHFTEPEVPYAFEVSGEMLALRYNVKNRACFSCVVPCSRVFVVKRFSECFISEGPEYEALAGMTVRIGNKDLDKALKAIELVNDLGMDVISVSEVLSWAMELYSRGVLSREEVGGLSLDWGDMEVVMELLMDIAYRRGFGDVLADGVVAAAEKLGKGLEIAFHVKRLEMIQADPRGLKGYGLGFAVSSRGADHLRSEPFIELSDDPEVGLMMFGEPEATLRLGVRGKGRLVAYYENLCALVDSLGVCKNLAENMDILNYQKVAKLVEAVTGMTLSVAEVEAIGERIVNLERVYDVREGVRREHDVLPERFLREPLKVGASTGHVIELDLMLDEYYRVRGWDVRSGIPTVRKLEELGLRDVVEDLRRMGLLPG
ncbi:MAG: aldehyde ferredoxin oxidoreductase family protein [Desulfurococcaceae archaeon]|nr:aldehyde ferredoxin oxidoreductase family protein [Desulfurococcaceae archaeon]